MSHWVASIRALLLPFLYGLSTACVLLLLGLLARRCVEALVARRQRTLRTRYQPIVDALLDPACPPETVTRLRQMQRRHRAMLGELLLAAVRPTHGAVVPRVLQAAAMLGLRDEWVRGLTDRRWWMRASAARALGFIHSQQDVERVLLLLDDPHEEVRAAAIDALGRMNDDRAIPALIARLHDDTRHQRTRIVDALRRLGPTVAPALIAHADAHPLHTMSVIDVLGVTHAITAVERLLTWSAAANADMRAAALRAIGSIGVDDRSFYYVLRGLEDDDATVRAMAARALGRSGRLMAAPYLSTHLADEWAVAAHAATGLRRLGHAGRTHLEQHATAAGQAGVLARQMLWELNRSHRAS